MFHCIVKHNEQCFTATTLSTSPLFSNHYLHSQTVCRCIKYGIGKDRLNKKKKKPHYTSVSATNFDSESLRKRLTSPTIAAISSPVASKVGLFSSWHVSKGALSGYSGWNNWVMENVYWLISCWKHYFIVDKNNKKISL